MTERDEQSARREDWEHTIGEARESIQRNHVEEAGHWKKSLVRVGRHLDELMEQWRARPLREWLHGDLHLCVFNGLEINELSDPPEIGRAWVNFLALISADDTALECPAFGLTFRDVGLNLIGDLR